MTTELDTASLRTVVRCIDALSDVLPHAEIIFRDAGLAPRDRTLRFLADGAARQVAEWRRTGALPKGVE